MAAASICVPGRQLRAAARHSSRPGAAARRRSGRANVQQKRKEKTREAHMCANRLLGVIVRLIGAGLLGVGFLTFDVVLHSATARPRLGTAIAARASKA